MGSPPLRNRRSGVRSVARDGGSANALDSSGSSLKRRSIADVAVDSRVHVWKVV